MCQPAMRDLKRMGIQSEKGFISHSSPRLSRFPSPTAAVLPVQRRREAGLDLRGYAHTSLVAPTVSSWRGVVALALGGLLGGTSSGEGLERASG